MKMNKNILYLGLVSFFTDFASAMINPILPVFVVYYLKEGVDKLGVIVAVATFVSYSLRLLSGYVSDRYGIVKPLVVAGYALSAFSKPLIGFSKGYASVAFLRAVERLGKALRSAPKDYLIAYFGDKKRMGKTFGFHKTLDIAGEFSGTLFLFLTLYLVGQSEEIVRGIFFATLFPSLVALLIVSFFVEDVKKKEKREKFAVSKEDKRVIKNLFFYFFFLFFFFNEAFFTMQAKEVGIGIAFIPLLFMLSTFVQTLTSYYSGMLIDKIGVEKTLLISYGFGVFAEALLLFKTPWATWLSYAFLGLFTVFSLNANRAYIAKDSKNVASVYGVFYAGVAVFGALGAFVIGLLWDKAGMENAVAFSLAGILCVFFLFLLRGGFVFENS